MAAKTKKGGGARKIGRNLVKCRVANRIRFQNKLKKVRRSSGEEAAERYAKEFAKGTSRYVARHGAAG